MILIVLMAALNALLFFGMVQGIDNALNLAVFIMWIMAILNFLMMFISEEKLIKAPVNHFLFRWTLRLLTVATVLHSVYWGYFFAPSVWLTTVVVLWARKYELGNRKRF